ncbi:DUF881 domain-containing protein [Nocardioides sp.]|uniref:DUF881 domain-containing protein n=1 Tax=Nocardioides sp. TaxID=35761 RepID=UPI003511FE37
MSTSDPVRARRRWRLATPVVLLLSGALVVVSAVNSDGTDLRPGRYTDLASLVQRESDDYTSLQRQAADLREEVDRLSDSVDDRAVRRLRQLATQVSDDAGLTAVSGPGLTITMGDAPEDRIEDAIADPDADLDLFVVHQQDLQAVVNALWSGGAAAITLQGQRIISSTGIKCRGSAVQLQGRPYPQPYTIQAVGDPSTLLAALDADADVGGFRADAADPAIELTWSVSPTDTVDAPAFEGTISRTSAQPVGPAE